jgi:hypothetical protein
MCKEMPVIPVSKVVDPKRIIRKKWRAEEEERHKGALTPPPQKKKKYLQGCNWNFYFLPVNSAQNCFVKSAPGFNSSFPSKCFRPICILE